MVWLLLLTTACVSFAYSFYKTIQRAILNSSVSWYWLGLVPLLFVSLLAPLSGWLADARLGNYKVFRAGTILLLISTVLNCLMLILEATVEVDNELLQWTLLTLTGTLFISGSCTCVVTALPLCLDQMPDASTSNITSLIAWFTVSLFIGVLLSSLLYLLEEDCLEEAMLSNYSIILAFLSTLCTSIVLTSQLLFHPKWLIIEPRAPQSLKTICYVLKFAATNRAPLNRSAFTYWQEEIPSRIDLGKSSYGGPFTTEQVEDVKTTLRLLAISIPLFLVVFSFTWRPVVDVSPSEAFPHLTLCTTDIVYLFSYHYAWCSILGAIAYEFVVYPLFRNGLPGILKRIGGVCLLMTLVSFVCLILELVHYYSFSEATELEHILSAVYQSMSGFLLQVLIASMLEFLCAQSPYNMRGLIVSFTVPVASLSIMIGWNTGHYLFTKFCPQSWCSPVSFSVKTVLCLFV